MTQIAYMIRDKSIDTMTEKCIESLRKVNGHCRIILFCIDINDFSKLDAFNVEKVQLNPVEWYGQRQVCKVRHTTKIPNIAEGDEVIVMDSDLLFNSDPFKVFLEQDFDVFYTSRNYAYYYSVNAGVWGFKNNGSSRHFLDFYNSEICSPKWILYINHIKKFRRTNVDWWVDQDFLCVINDNKEELKKLMPNLKIFDAGYRYNFCPSYDFLGDQAVEQIKQAIGNPAFVILHLKAELKKVLGLA